MDMGVLSAKASAASGAGATRFLFAKPAHHGDIPQKQWTAKSVQVTRLAVQFAQVRRGRAALFVFKQPNMAMILNRARWLHLGDLFFRVLDFALHPGDVRAQFS
jgi:hypothetical protein